MSNTYIKSGTPVGSESLCRTCANAQIMTGYRASEQIILCTSVHPNLAMPFQVYECSGYHDKNRPSWEQMTSLAIDLTPGPIKPVGFKAGAGFMAEVIDSEN